ncbi:hypothetical protein OG936_00470 [Streptomyces sp. NBC_00846]|uniref:hypothetical protein n=1 Tax=Streptomyces sp. NBC_00846 TaxID=2975849 RepID=UPI003863EAC4|nr:hypothetical protein OG936_00470 [Streptomyces sp. NBC_00846]
MVVVVAGFVVGHGGVGLLGGFRIGAEVGRFVAVGLPVLSLGGLCVLFSCAAGRLVALERVGGEVVQAGRGGDRVGWVAVLLAEFTALLWLFVA